MLQKTLAMLARKYEKAQTNQVVKEKCFYSDRFYSIVVQN